MPPIAVGVALAAVAVGAAVAAGAAGAGKSKYQAKTFSQTSDYDPTKFLYGGNTFAAGDAISSYNAQAGTSSQQANNSYAQADAAMQQGQDARGGAVQNLNLINSRAQGQNLISNKVADSSRSDLGARLTSAVASARGPAALATSQQDAIAAQAQGSAQINRDAMTAGASEQQQAELAGYNASMGLRGSDQQQQGMATTQGNNFTAQAQNYQGMAADVTKQQNQMNLDQQHLLSGSNTAASQVNSNIATNNAQADLGYYKMAAGGVAGAAQTAMGAYGGGKAGGGDVEGGRPYLVGEHGPELVVPSKDGVVVPNRLTKALTGPSRGGPAALSLLDVPEGQTIRQTADGHGYYDDVGEAQPALASMAGSSSSASPEARSAPQAPKRPMTPAEINAAADRMMQQIESSHSARMANGPSVRQQVKLTPAQMDASAQADREMAGLKASMAEGPAIRHLSYGNKENGYQTELNSASEAAYQRQFPSGADKDYDLRGAYAQHMTDGQSMGADGTFPGHLPDTFKKPNHPTFSNESLYASDEPNMAGSWNGNNYAPNPSLPPDWLRNYMDDQPQASDPRAKKEAYDLGRKHMGQELSDKSGIGLFRAYGRMNASQSMPALAASYAQDVMDAHQKEEDRFQQSRPRNVPATAPHRGLQLSTEGVSVDPSARGELVVAPRTYTVGGSDVQRGFDVTPKEALFSPKEPHSMEEAALLDSSAQMPPDPNRGPMSIDRDEQYVTKPVPRFNIDRDAQASDPRAKIDMVEPQDNEVSRTLDATPAVSYRYRDAGYEPGSSDPTGRQAGFLTSDLKKTELGSSVVEKRDDGLDGYNQHRMIGLQHAEIQNLHERLRQLEGSMRNGRR